MYIHTFFKIKQIFLLLKQLVSYRESKAENVEENRAVGSPARNKNENHSSFLSPSQNKKHSKYRMSRGMVTEKKNSATPHWRV